MLNEPTVYDLLDPSVRGNPHPVLHRMRREAPVLRSHHREMGDHPWIVTRYDDALFVLTDERLTKDMVKRPHAVIDTSDPMNQAAAAINRHMLTVDPPDHTRLRSLVHKAFTPRMIRQMHDRVQAIADRLTDAMLSSATGEVDLMHEYAIPLPVIVIAELLGIPQQDQDKFREWSQIIVFDGVKNPESERLAVAALEFMMYFHEMFDTRRAEPQEDLISGLVQVEEAGDRLDHQELLSMVFLLLVAGHETTVNLIANGTLALLQHPDQMQKLKDAPGLIETAVEEMLRYDGPIGVSTMRWAMEDITLRGVTIPAGEMVTASLLGANRDPDQFPDPDRFDITRKPNRHIAFGHGIHYCLGAPLARMEGAIAINTLLRRLPGLALNTAPESLHWNETLLLHGMESLPLRFTRG